MKKCLTLFVALLLAQMGCGDSLAEGPAVVPAGEKVASKDAPIPSAVTSADNPAALKAGETELNSKILQDARTLSSLDQWLRMVREKTIKTDSELAVLNKEIAEKQAALNKEIAEKQAALDKKLAEKYPDMAAKIKEREAVAQRLSELRAKLKEVRKKQQEEPAKPVPVEEKK